ncbi:MAG: hypothetical protein ACOCP9_03245 [Halofilum sp. (in: g-proteobacteria)]
MAEQPSRIDRIMQHLPEDRRVVAETIRTCAVWEFSAHWPEAADDMAAVVCGRWLHSALTRDDQAVSSATPHVDRLVNECYATLDDEQIAATERMFDELSGFWRDL